MSSWGRFYTPLPIAEAVVSKAVAIVQPGLAGDVCAGSGAFLKSLKERCPECRVIAVDIRGSALNAIAGLGIGRLEALKADAADLSDGSRFLTRMAPYMGKWDLALANPPFGRLGKERGGKCASIIKDDPTLLELWKRAMATGRIEACILVSNVILLRVGGVLGSVMPENVFSCDKYKQFRDVLFGECLETIWLTDAEQVFGGSDVRTRRIVAARRRWTRHTSWNIPAKPVPREVPCVEVKRGQYAKKRDRKSRWPKSGLVTAVHSDHFRCLGVLTKPKERRYIRRSVVRHKSLPLLVAGDVAVLRVGKKAGRVAVVPNGYAGWTISDCVLLVRNWSAKSKKRMRLLCEELTARARERGLVVRYVTVQDVQAAIWKISADARKA